MWRLETSPDGAMSDALGNFCPIEENNIKIGNLLYRFEYKFLCDRNSFSMVYWVKER